MTIRGDFRVVAVQATPAYFDRDATLDIVVDHVNRAGVADADLVVSLSRSFPDTRTGCGAASRGTTPTGTRA
jgi:hypothetical protein